MTQLHDLHLIVAPQNLTDAIETSVLANLGEVGRDVIDKVRPLFVFCDNGVWRDYEEAPSLRYDGGAAVGLRVWQERIGSVLETLLDKHGAIDTHRLKEVGRCLANGLLPRDLRDRLGEIAKSPGEDGMPTLRIHTNLDWIPWELMLVGNRSLGEVFQVALLPLPLLPEENYLKPTRWAEEKPVEIKSVYSLLGKGTPLAGESLDEWWKTFAFNHDDSISSIVTSYPSAADANDYPVLENLETALRQESAIVYITCMGRVDGGEPVWTLDYDNEIASKHRVRGAVFADIQFPDTERPLLFANACGSVRLGPGQTHIACRAVEAGALASVSAFARITPKLAVKFATKFFELLLAPESTGEPIPIGQALLQTKRHFAKTASEDPSYLFYRLYGKPETAFRVESG
jgi:hypothetical protein